MAIYSKQTNHGINEVRAVTLGTEGGSALIKLNEFAPSESGFATYAAVLNGRYVNAGSTPWERPPVSG